VQQFFVKGLAHSSYLLGGANNCAIIDPRRDIDIYSQAAENTGMKITHILEIHLYADLVSDHLNLAEKTDAIIHPPWSVLCAFKHTVIVEEDTFEINGQI